MERILVYGMTDNPGGIETYLLNLAYRLGDDIAFDFVSDFPAIAHAGVLKDKGSRFYFIPPKGKRLLSHWRGLWRILKAHPEYQTVYFNILDAGGAISELIPWLLGRRIVTHSHNSDTDKKRLHRLCKPFLRLFTKEYVACSPAAAVYMFGSSKQALILPNAIDAKRFAFDSECRKQMRQELGVADTPVICHIGRLSLQKNPIRMLDIFKEVLKIRPDAVLLSVGTGELEKEVHAYAEQIGVAAQVHFFGRQDDVVPFLQAADVFFLPSLYEGLGIVVVEAQAAGLPCVVSTEVPRDADLTGNVQFVSLNEPDSVWTDILLKATAKQRKDTYDSIVSHGYDMYCCRDKDIQLMQLLASKEK